MRTKRGGPVALVAAVVDEDGGIMGLHAEGDNQNMGES